jgi:conjugal transfer/type IV secretion protein DotA/TraY
MIDTITKKQVIKYALLPQVLPRFRGLISSGFANLAYFIALVYRATNILPENHLYLKQSSIGKYTIRNVITEASKNLVFDTKHIDQVIIFFALLAGLFILAAQFFILLIAIFVSPASAALPTGIGEFFVTPSPDTDLAFQILNSVFGVPQMFGTTVTQPDKFHEALHALFQLYSFGLLVVAVIIIIYFIFAIVAETAQTGTPFGKRYNHVWAPIRLVVGVGMLVPMAYGLNAGQWITLHAAKLGSGFASTGWVIFNESINEAYLDEDTLVATPKLPDLYDVAAFMMITKACKHAYEKHSEKLFPDAGDQEIKMYIINDDGIVNPEPATSYGEAVQHSNGGDIHIRFGQKKKDYTEATDEVYPYCGDLVIQNTEPYNDEGAGEFGPTLTSTQLINQAYYRLVFTMWHTNFEEMGTNANNFVDRRLDDNHTVDEPAVNFKETVTNAAYERIQDTVNDAVDQASGDYETFDQVEEFGWAGAAIWYNQIADVNGRLTSAALNKPQLKAYPSVMEYTCQENKQQNNSTSPIECYDPALSKGLQVQHISKLDTNITGALSDLFDYWHRDPKDQTGNVFIDVVNAIFGTQGLFDMCENADIHPLAQLSSIGKGMVEAAIRNLGLSLGVGAAGILTGYFGPTLDAASGFLGTVASIGILIGFILYYIIPFLPFLYFLFAVGGWVKGLFEAMVGVPLWALAHLRIDGEGLPGDAAINGYFLIFEIFVRPILIIFGLIASILIFGAMVKVLNSIFNLAVSNLSGFDPQLAPADGDPNAAIDTSCSAIGTPNVAEPGTIEWMRGPVDEFFFTVIYAIMVYMIGMSCFKLIDLIPNSILRWMGQGVQTFNDLGGEPAEGLLQKVAIGGSMLGGQLGGAVQGFKGAASNAAAGLKQFNQ